VKLYSYIVARDYGFAPNPFFGFCTLATCKPNIRKMAVIGDWIVGTGSKVYQRDGHLVYAMKVSEILTYDKYWRDPRFCQKKPNLRGSLKRGYGDNIYHRDPNTHQWIQENSHHSYPNGRPNPNNIKHDTQTPNVLISAEFSYWGGSGPKIPVRFRNYNGFDVCGHRGHKCKFPQVLIDSFVAWIQSLDEKGCVGDPAEFDT